MKPKKVKVKTKVNLEFRTEVLETAYKVLNDRCAGIDGKIEKLTVDHGSIHPDRISLQVFKGARPYIWGYILFQTVLSIVLLIAILK